MISDTAPSWVKVNRHLQKVGTATCDVSNLILEADIQRSDNNLVAAQNLMGAARVVLNYQRRLCKTYAQRLRTTTDRRKKPK